MTGTFSFLSAYFALFCLSVKIVWDIGFYLPQMI